MRNTKLAAKHGIANEGNKAKATPMEVEREVYRQQCGGVGRMGEVETTIKITLLPSLVAIVVPEGCQNTVIDQNTKKYQRRCKQQQEKKDG